MDVLSLVFFYLFFCALAAWMAAKRGRSIILYLMMAVIFSPLVSILVLLVAGKSETGMEQKALSNGFKRCPACAELVRREAKICKHCGTDLGPPPKSTLEQLRDLDYQLQSGKITLGEFERERTKILK
ncbi:hypothetical protein G7008_03360 [Pseudomonas psychrotolerans]|uniref:zinc ribbon domain-containing protein n=1 Tax=Pseudomonas oryzihabitans TaxID=47885 RepID=UPI0015E2C2BE|nr:zinc ribbon domain-containing protein [Pseudomonas psychrotolerans]MBA1179535.1 hypothetical protein [Pseudomonas psychrotolerans]MBA1214501.1 hypothetical protein [Pseudomonas psychrotolerans]